MATTPDLSLLALRVYSTKGAIATDGDKELNRPAVPIGWIEKEWHADDGTGFSYGVYQNGTEIVISYAGTNESGDWLTNIANGIGLGSTQTTKAALAYLQAKQQYGSNITFTGHSLGGGLASIMSVWFDRPAVVFDEATFEVEARSPLIFLATKASLALAGYDLGAFATYTGVLDFAAREANVTNHYLEGEALYYLRLALPTILGAGQDHVIQANIADMTGTSGMIDLHSQALLAAMLVSNDFRLATYASSRVIPLLMDDKFYAYDTKTDSKENVLINFIRGEQGTGDKLTHFAADLNKLGTNIAGLNKTAQDAILAQGIEWYYWQGTDYAGQEFFTKTGELLQYSTDETHNKAFQYVSQWLDPIVQASGGDHISYDYDQWNIAAGSDGSTATARNTDKTQIFIGGDGADTFTGGDKVDTILAGSGADTLNGGSGGDLLCGGTGNDTYQLTSGELFDVITDSDGNGTIWVDGLQLTGGKKAAGDYWISEDKQWGCSLTSGGDLLISKGTSPDTITIRDWQANGGDKLGIILDDTPATTPTATNTFNGDFTKLKNEEGTAYLLGSDGNYQNNGAQLGAPDVLNGTSGADAMYGLDGNDGIAGRDGDDLIEGGAGDDLLLGGQGADTINGGDGSDEILGSDNGMISHPGSVNFTPPASSGTELSRGFSWVIYVPTNADNYIIDGGGDFYSNGETKGNVIDGGAGEDRIGAGSGADIAHGGEGNDIVTGMGAGDVLFGDAGDDFVMGDGYQCFNGWYSAFAEHGADFIDGGAGNDALRGQGGNDVVYGGTEDDHVWGDDNNSARTPGNIHGNDYLDGEDGNDTLYGGGRDDILYGGVGNDTLSVASYLAATHACQPGATGRFDCEYRGHKTWTPCLRWRFDRSNIKTAHASSMRLAGHKGPCANSTRTVGLFCNRNRPDKVQVQLVRRFQYSNIKITHANSVRLAGHEWLRRHMDVAWLISYFDESSLDLAAYGASA